MEARPKTGFLDSTKYSSKRESRYTVLVPLQDIHLSKTLLPPAIRAAKRHDGKIILLNVIEIPYQLPPSEAEQFILEREFKLQYARQIIETAGGDGEVIVHIAHRLPHAIEQLAGSLDIDLIIMWARRNGLLWNKEIYQKLHDVNSNLVVVKEQVEIHLEKVIIQVDNLSNASTVLEQATYLLGTDEGAIHIIPNFGQSEQQQGLNSLRSTIDTFHWRNPSFTGKTNINQLQPKFAARECLKDIYQKATGSTCLLVSYPSGKKSRTENWLENEANKLNLPVFLSKVGRAEPVGINQLTNKLKKWMGIAS